MRWGRKEGREESERDELGDMERTTEGRIG